MAVLIQDREPQLIKLCASRIGKIDVRWLQRNLGEQDYSKMNNHKVITIFYLCRNESAWSPMNLYTNVRSIESDIFKRQIRIHLLTWYW